MKRIKGHIKNHKLHIKNIPKENNSTINNKYVSYQKRIIFLSILLVISYISIIFFTRNSFGVTDEKRINVSEKSNTNYKVYLKENEFYENNYLEGESKRGYISSLIENIKVEFNYDFRIDKEVDSDFEYEVVAELIISDNNNTSKFFSKEYTLLEKQKKHAKDIKKYHINEKLTIDYNYYNTLANKFKTSYGLDAQSKLNIYLKVNKKTNLKGKNTNILKTPSTTTITIPLTEKAVKINIDEKSYNNFGEVIEESNVIINKIYIVIAIILTIIAIGIVLKISTLLSYYPITKNKYDKQINKILKEYDRLIVETTTLPNLNELNIFKISKFSELLDVRDNLKLPIMYYIVSKHNKSHFYIKNNNDIYILTIKAVDIE